VFLFDPVTLDTYVREDLALIERIRPHVVVGDMRLSLSISSRLAGVPWVNVMNAHFSPASPVQIRMPTHPLQEVLGDCLAEALWNAFLPLSCAIATTPLNLARLRHGLPFVSWDVREVYSHGDYTLYPDVPELSPLTHVPATHSYIGPLLWSPSVALPDWWSELSDQPVVYVGLGSSGNPALLEVIVRVLGALPVTVLVATAGRVSLAQLPPNARLAEFLPGSAAAARARLTICNGGSMPGQQSLAEGTPILGITSNLDQAMFMQYVTRAGAGETIPEGAVTPARLHETVCRLLGNDSYRATAGRIRQAIRTLDGPRVFNRLVETLTASPRPGRAPAP
jgi:UDP:flavonoid glycosyltransferase YjiC (YdhE family)